MTLKRMLLWSRKLTQQISIENNDWWRTTNYSNSGFYPGIDWINCADLSRLQKSVNTARTAGVAGVFETVIKGMRR